MHEGELLWNLAIVVVAALIGGGIARLLRLPVLVGFLAAGIFIGPRTPGFIADEQAVRPIAEVGVVLLMFAVGVQFSLKELGAVRRTALVSGTVQILGTVALGMLLAPILGWNLYEGVFLGAVIALSSTAIAMRMLEERAEMGSTHGGIILGIAVVQDLSLVVMVSLLPALKELQAGPEAIQPVLIAVLKATGFVAATLLLATRAIPKVLDLVARTGSQELFLLTVVCLALVAAAVAEVSGLGFALGAFLAGVVISESSYAHEVFSQVRPLRDVFASIFFVSIGMLLDPAFVFENWAPVLLVAVAVLVAKGAITVGAILLEGWHLRTALLAGLGLAQIGEFSFVLAGLGIERQLISSTEARVIYSAALVTILVWPFAYQWVSPFYESVARMPVFAKLVNRAAARALARSGDMEPEVLILGAGRVGRYVSDSLRAHHIPHVVVDLDSVAVERMRANDVPVIYGDASSRTVLDQAIKESVRLAVVALAESATTEMAVKALRSMSGRLPIVARVRRGVDIPRMREAGASGVVHGEFESGVEMIRQSLDHLGFKHDEVERYVGDVRQYRYRDEDLPVI